MSSYFRTSAIAPGVTREDGMDWGYILVGAKTALIKSRLCQPDWFVADGQFDRKGRTLRKKSLVVDGHEIETVTPSKGKCRVYIRFTDSEVKAAQIRAELSKAKEDEREQIKQLPQSHEQFRDESGEFLDRLIELARTILQDCRGGYRFSPDVIDRFDIAAGQLRQIVFESRSTFDARQQKREIAEIKARTARLDPGLQRFIAGLDFSSRQSK